MNRQLYHIGQKLKRRGLSRRRVLTDSEKDFLKRQDVKDEINNLVTHVILFNVGDVPSGTLEREIYEHGLPRLINEYCIPDAVKLSSGSPELFFRYLTYLERVAEKIPYLDYYEPVDAGGTLVNSHSHPLWSDIDFEKLLKKIDRTKKRWYVYHVVVEEKIKYNFRHVENNPRYLAGPLGSGSLIYEWNTRIKSITETIYNISII